MTESIDLLKTLTLVLGVAGLTCLLFHRLRQPVVLGYLLAGLIIGPHVPIPLVADSGTVHTLAELGVILLMFSLGLEFSLRKLVKVLPTAGVIALIQCSLMLWLGYIAGRLFGWTELQSIYAGAIIAISSTTIIVKAFSEEGIKGGLAQLVFAILIVEDLIAVILLSVLPLFSQGEGFSALVLGKAVGTLAVFLIVLLIGGLLILPRFIRWVMTFHRPEITLLICVSLAFGFSLLADEMGYSVALGAFLAGSLLAESGEEKYLEHLVAPVKDILAAVFFVSVGMMIDPKILATYWEAILIFTGLVIFGKIFSVALGSFFTGNSTRLSIQSGMSLAQIGEFSFIIAAAGLTTQGGQNFLYPIAVSVSAITTLTTPWLIRHSDAAASWIDRKLPRSLQTFSTLYATWMHRLRRPRATGQRSLLKRLVIFLLLDMIFLAGILISSSFLLADYQMRLSSYAGLPVLWTRILLIAFTLLLALPFIIGIIRMARGLGEMLAMQALPKENGDFDLAAAPRRAMIVALQLGGVLLIGGPLLAITSPFIPFYVGAILMGILLIGLSIAFWRSAINLQGHVKAGAEVLLDKIKTSMDGKKEKNEFETQEFLPGLGPVFSFSLAGDSAAVEKTLTQLNLRAFTGANIIAITRKTGGVIVPSGKEVLHEGDKLFLTGTEESLELAKEMLQPKTSTASS